MKYPKNIFLVIYFLFLSIIISYSFTEIEKNCFGSVLFHTAFFHLKNRPQDDINFLFFCKSTRRNVLPKNSLINTIQSKINKLQILRFHILHPKNL